MTKVKKQAGKKGWTAPTLTVHGSVEEITRQTFIGKNLGSNDGTSLGTPSNPGPTIGYGS